MISMPMVAFIRSKTVFDCWDFYESKTEVIIFGDRAGYRILSRKLLRASRSKVNIEFLSRNQNSMRVVILPVQKAHGRSPRLKFVERFVHFQSVANMELVIAGNAAGYRYFAGKLSGFLAASRVDVTDHIHLDDMADRVVIPRSVALHIRAPLVKWTSKGLGDFAHLVEARGDDFLPKEIEHRFSDTDGYEKICVKQSEVVRL